MADFVSGTLTDWFNLSAQLGQSDQEDLALQACLHGLAQQAGREFLIRRKDGSFKLDWPKELPPNQDLLAHALQFSGAISTPYTDALLELSGYAIGDAEARKSWNWRNYIFTMETLAELPNRRQEAFAIGKAYIDDNGTDERVVMKYANLLYEDGLVKLARDVAEGWITAHPKTATPQLVTFLVDRFDYRPEEVVRMATRGIADLAVDQPTASPGNLVLQRGFAYDKLAHAEAEATPGSPTVCDFIVKALADFDLAEKLLTNPQQLQSLRRRRLVLASLAKANGCTGGDFAPDEPEDDENEARQAALQLLRALNSGEPGAKLLGTVRGLISGVDGDTAKALRSLIHRLANGGDAPDELRANAKFIAENLPAEPE